MPTPTANMTPAQLYAESRSEPSASRRWGVCSALTVHVERLTTYGWYKTEKQAMEVACYLRLAGPVISRWYDSEKELSRTLSRKS